MKLHLPAINVRCISKALFCAVNIIQAHTKNGTSGFRFLLSLFQKTVYRITVVTSSTNPFYGNTRKESQQK
jgi:hypothetical protein